MIPLTYRPYLQDLRETAQGMAKHEPNRCWARAYIALAEAADRLDAMQARMQSAPKPGLKEEPPPFTEPPRASVPQYPPPPVSPGSFTTRESCQCGNTEAP